MARHDSHGLTLDKWICVEAVQNSSFAAALTLPKEMQVDFRAILHLPCFCLVQPESNSLVDRPILHALLLILTVTVRQVPAAYTWKLQWLKRHSC